MDEALGVIKRLLSGETVTCRSNWFELNDARLHLDTYTKPMIELAVASQVSPAGPRAAGKHGASLLSIGATSVGGFDMLGMNWQQYEEQCNAHGNLPSRDNWRLVGPMHIAETTEKAYNDIEFGFADWLFYFQKVANLPLGAEADSPRDAAKELVDQGFAVIGTPEEAITQIDRLTERSGGFGTFLHLAHNWADWDTTKRSYELFRAIRDSSIQR